jgi:putative transcriptional regulator
MTQILAHVRGEIELKSYTLPGPIDVKAIRKKVGMSQSEFASAFALNRRTLQEWEQGKTAPDNAVRAYLTVIERNPEAVVEAPRFLHLATHGVYEPSLFTSHQIVGGIPAAAATYQTSSIVPVAARGSIVAISGTSLEN